MLSRQLEFRGVTQAGESATWGSSMYMLFKDMSPEGHPEGVRVDGGQKRSERRALGLSEAQKTGDQEESAKTEKAGW